MRDVGALRCHAKSLLRGFWELSHALESVILTGPPWRIRIRKIEEGKCPRWLRERGS